jgi:hypothetical protein
MLITFDEDEDERQGQGQVELRVCGTGALSYVKVIISRIHDHIISVQLVYIFLSSFDVIG